MPKNFMKNVPKQRNLEEVLKEKASSELINKRATLVKAAEGDDASYDLKVMAPTDDQLKKINALTRSEKNADQVAVLPSLACNDMLDRDLDIFSTKSIEGFASLPQPFSPIGKSFLVGHNHQSLPIGRLFDAEAIDIGSNKFLKTYSYVPNTDQYKDFLENVDFGIYWAVSVGVMFGKATCNIGKVHDWSSYPWFCSKGHIKGEYYDPESDEEDDWGWPEPLKESERSKGVMTFCTLDEAKDFYELSQVFLGAQFMAEHAEKKAGFIKAASAKVPILGISTEETEELPVLQNEKISEASKKYELALDVEGNVTWTDENSLVWIHDASTNEVKCLGKAKEITPDPEEVPVKDDSEDSEDAPKNSEEGGEESMPKDKVVAVAKEAGLPSSLIEKLEKSEDTAEVFDLALKESGLAISALEEENKTFKEKAALGDAYIKDLRADAVEWYVKANQPDAKGHTAVDVKIFEKILDSVGDNVEAIKALADQQRQLAQAKFPGQVRRSTFDSDPNESSILEAPSQDDRTAKTVSKLHR